MNRPLVSGITITKLYNEVKARARRYNREFKIRRALFDVLIVSNCHYCKQPPTNYRTVNGERVYYNGLDRVVNSMGYLPNNVVACCFRCNNYKNAKTLKQLEQSKQHLVALS